MNKLGGANKRCQFQNMPLEIRIHIALFRQLEKSRSVCSVRLWERFYNTYNNVIFLKFQQISVQNYVKEGLTVSFPCALGLAKIVN